MIVRQDTQIDRSGRNGLQRAAALVFTVFSAGYLWQARNYPYLDDTGPGAGFFAVWIGALGVLVGVAMLMHPQRAAGATEEVTWPAARRTVLLTLGALLAAGLGLETAGFRITAFLLLGGLLRVYGATWRNALLFAAVMSLVVFQLFDALNLRLPLGVFGL